MIIHKPVPGVSPQALSRFAERARRAARLHGKVNVLLASSREIQELNRRYRGKNKPTDVLSFPPIPSVQDDFAGDVIVAGDVAAANARRFGHNPTDEIKVLILHAMLHLAGYDHESDNGKMARREQRLRRELGLSAGLIERSEQHLANGDRRRAARSPRHGAKERSRA